MDVSDESLELVFGALDTENKGFITVDQFVSTFREFYDGPAQHGRKVSTSRSAIENLVHVLDPENDGIIHFEDFKKAFQSPIEFSGHPDDPNITHVDSNMFSPSSATNRSTCFSDGLENKTDDSGVHTHEPSIYDCDNDSALSVDGVQSSRLQRDDIRRSWPKHRGPAFMNADLPESPASASRSDILMDDMETNLELMRDQIQRMEERVEGIHSTHQSEKESRIDRLREENARITAQVTVLEERLKEAEARAQRSVEAERNHLQGIIDLKRNTEALADAQDQLRALQQEKESVEKKHQRDIEILRKDRDHAVQVLEELNGSSERRRSRLGSTCTSMSGGSEALARYQESQEIVRRLIQENKELRKQLEDARDEMFAMSLEEGRTLANISEKAWSKEIDNCTKEEVVEMWTREKHANEQLRNYIDSLITRIIERHPSLLEVAAAPAR
ncbi:Rab11 family-interacting protein 3 [Fasciola hepatica]|uniref:Rab11 family-interacting protein 3 n=1 Tax=Fasciola hepatica TaxID=6192 RepID=A0A4E0S3S2_FASHE|nr:Rab11 family-interacting protein 3 [Fasciola hepatica]